MNITVSFVSATAGTVGRAMSALRGMWPKYVRTHVFAESALKSPAIVMVALFGA